MRAPLAIVLVALAVALAFFLGARDPRSPELTDTVVERDDVAGDRDGAPGQSELTRPDRSRVEETAPRVRPVPATGGTREPERFDDWQIVGRLVTALDGSPLHGYTICVQPTGTKLRGPLPADGLTETDADGAFLYEGLDRRGPWDVFAFALDPTGAPRSLSRLARIGFARAARPGETKVQTFTLRAGPLVVLRSQLPKGIEVSDVLLEARGRTSRFSSQIGRLGGYARAFETPEGHCAGRIPDTPNSVQNDGFGVRAVTTNGLWSIAERRDGRLLNNTEAAIDQPLQARGKIVVRIEADDTDVDLTAATRFVGWRLPLGDPERDDLALPASMATTARSHPLIARGDGLFEVHDLPVGAVEVLTRENVRTVQGEAAYEVVLPVQAQAVHGEPDPVTVRLRRVR